MLVNMVHHVLLLGPIGSMRPPIAMPRKKAKIEGNEELVIMGRTDAV